MESGVTSENGAAPRAGAGGWRVLLAVGALMLLTAGLRAYRLDQQSLWFDEYHSAAHLEAPDFATYLTLIRAYNSEHVPLYYVINYCWSLLVGTAPANLRWLSILFNVLTVPVLYALGRHLFNRRAGLIAALFFALSPMQLWHGQSIRPYALLVLAGAVCMYTFVRAVQGDGKRWWFLHGAATALLVWTHPFGVLLPAGMAAAFPFLDGARWRRLLLWGAFNALLVLSVGVYFLLTPINLPESAYVFFQTPTLEKFLFNLAGNDTLMRLELYPDGSTWPWLPTGVAAVFSRVRSASDWLVLAVGFATMAWLAWGLRPGLERAGRRRAALLLGVAAGPVFLLVFLSLIWRPCIMPRYTLYCSLALYVAIGGFLSQLGRAGLRRACLALLAGVYLVQLSFVLPAVTRTNWGGLVGHLSQFMQRDDAVVLFGMLSPPRHAFLYHARQSGHEENRFKLVSAFTVPMLCEKAGQFFSQKPDAVMWVVYDQAYQWGPNPLLVQCLERRGYTVNYMEFIAQENLIMYPVRRGNAAIGATSECGECVTDPRIFDKLLDAPGVAFATPQEREAAQASLAKMLDVAWPADKFTLALTGMFLAWGHDPALGQRFAEASLRMAPDFGWGDFALGFALCRLGNTEGARQAFDRAFAHDPFLALYRPLAAALCETGVSDRTRAEADRLGRMGMDAPEFLYE